MATEIGVFTPGDAERVWKAVQAFERGIATSKGDERRFVPAPIYVKNRSTTLEIPAYGCMQVVGTEEIGGQNYLIVDRPFDYSDSSFGPFLLNSPAAIEPEGLGVAQNGPVFRAIKDTGTFTIGTRLNPTADSFKLSKGPLFVYLGDDDIDTDIIKVERCETPLLAVATSGIAANSSGTVTAKQPASGNWTAGSVTYTAWNPTGDAIGSNKTVLIWPVDAKWVAIEVC